MKTQPMDCALELGVRLQMLRFKAAAMGELNAAVLMPLIGQADIALTAVKQTLEDLAQIVLQASKRVDRDRLEIAQLRNMVTRIVLSQGGKIALSKSDLEAPIPKGTILSNGLMDDGGLEIVVTDKGRAAA